MRWGKKPNPEDPEGCQVTDKSVLHINDRCKLVGIPPSAHEYTVSERSPLEWAVDSLKHKHDKASGITDDPNGWWVWADDPFELIRHLRRLAYVGIRSAEIIAALPLALDDDPGPRTVQQHPGKE